mmetsp:Transcript_11336/g.26662  ORF Transcript_11336/g.26662 Transcript_11336/m.26662 type:complete len:205 (-) Transcript_11336:3-617(-)
MLGREPQLQAEGGSTQLVAGYGRTQSISLLDDELAVPEAPSYEGIGHVASIVRGLGAGETGGKADLGLPSRKADTDPHAVAEGQDAKGLGYLRYGDGGAFGTQWSVGLRREEGKGICQEVIRQVLQVGTCDNGFWFGRHGDAFRPFGFGRGYRDRLEARPQILDACRRRHGGGGIRRYLDESGTLSLVLDSTRWQRRMMMMMMK